MPRLSSPPRGPDSPPRANGQSSCSLKEVTTSNHPVLSASRAPGGKLPANAACVLALLLFFVASSAPARPARPGPVFPMAVWYGGGKARAPMLEADPRAKKEVWRRDLKQIKALGFNTVRCWIDWASGEPGRAVSSRHPRRPALSRRGGGAQGHRAGLHGLGARVGGAAVPGLLFVSSNGQAIRPESSPGYCLDHPGVREGRPRLLRGGRAARRREPRVPRLRPVERAARHQLGEPDLHPEPRVLLLPEHRRALPRVAEEEVRHARRAERRVVPPPTRRGTRSSRTASARSSRTPTTSTGSTSSPPSSARTCARDTRRRSAARRTAWRRATPPASASSPRRTTGKASPTTGRWPRRSTTTGPPSTRSTRPSWTGTSSGAGLCSTSRARSDSRTAAAASGSASCRAASARSR